MASHPYSGIEIKIKDKHIGYILKNHFTWPFASSRVAAAAAAAAVASAVAR